MTNSNYVVVFHNCYFSASDNGCRVYSSDDSYLVENPSMFVVLESFYNVEDANEYRIRQPCMEM